MPNTERALRWGIAGSGKICSDFCTALKGNPENHQVTPCACKCDQLRWSNLNAIDVIVIDRT